MNFEFVRTPLLIRILYPMFTWRMPPGDEPTIYLTFDDGPIPHVTNLVLQLLKEHDCRASFFCIGENVEKFPQVVSRMKADGHAIGNHSYSHPNGWHSSRGDYLRDVQSGSDAIKAAIGCEPTLFRPPFGRIAAGSIWPLVRRYRTIMWDVLSLDYREELSPETIATNVLDNVTDGSIVLFHDSASAGERVVPALKEILPSLKQRGYRMEAIPDGTIFGARNGPPP